MNMPEPVSGGFWPGSVLRTALTAGARLLPLVAILWGLYLTGIARKSGEVNPKSDEQVKTRATLQPSQPGQPTSKPSPIIVVDATRVEDSTAPQQASPSVAHPLASSLPPYSATRYEATRKKLFGGCTGRLELTSSMLEFQCPDQADLIFPVAAIAKAHKNGVILKSGEKYHFMIADHTRGQVEDIFVSWLNRVHQIQQSSQVSSF
jgi:hypothetical protein